MIKTEKKARKACEYVLLARQFPQLKKGNVSRVPTYLDSPANEWSKFKSKDDETLMPCISHAIIFHSPAGSFALARWGGALI